jgi:anti-anti-sigma factor
MVPLVIIESPPRLDVLASVEFERFAVGLVNAGAVRFVVNLAPVDYLGSAGVRSLMVIGKALAARQGRLAILAARPSVVEVLRICGLADQFLLVENLDQARQHL